MEDEKEKCSIHSSLRSFTLKSILNIQKAIENNKLVVFVGAGVSKNSGIPTWYELVHQLAQDLGLNAKAHDLGGLDFWGGDDFLKIPQYYFNEREEKEYLDRIKEILNRDVPPNQIHDIIFDLNPAHIITTNYDDLLEKEYAIKETNKRYFKVACDTDLSSSSVSNYIIKMHGEFDNIVLKESDYDSYSNNFKLLETYIKGLFATHIILFIGFGGTDPNIRRLIQWVKDIVGSKHQPAYLIDTADYDDVSSEEFRIKHEYYKKQGIFTLYKKQIKCDIENNFEKCQYKDKINLNGQGLDLYKFLYFIKNYKFFDVDKYYYTLKQLESLNVIDNTILRKVFNVNIVDRLYRHYQYPNESAQQKFELDALRLKIALTNPDNLDDNFDLLRYNSILKEEFKTKIDNIADIKTDENKKLLKDLITQIVEYYPISIEETTKIKYIIKVIEKAQEYENQILGMRYLQYEYFNEDTNDDCNKKDIFAKAFDLYNMHKYVDAYYELSSISKKYQGDPIIYYIAEFNKKTVAGNINWEKNGFDKILSKEAKLIAENYHKINLNNIIEHKMPESIRGIMKLFTIENVKNDYFSFINITDKIKDYKTLLSEGGSGTNHYYTDLIKKLSSFFNYTIGNYIFINRYQETSTLFFHVIEAIFESYTTQESDRKNFINFGLNKIRNINYFILFIICEFVSNKQFCYLLKRLKIKKLELSNNEDPKNLLIKAFKNYLSSILSCNGIQIKDKIKNFFTIFSLININIDEFKDIVYEYTKFINSYIPLSKEIDFYNYRGSLHEDLAEFIVNVTLKYKENKVKLPNELYEVIIDKYKDIDTLSTYDYLRLIDNCILALSNTKRYQLKNPNLINFYIENADKIKYSDYILADFYLVASPVDKKKIKKFFSTKLYKNITTQNSNIMYKIIDNKIISLSKKIENNLLNTIETEIQNKLNRSDNHESSRDGLINILGCLIDFMLNHKIKNIEKVRELISQLEKIKYKNEYNIQEFDELLRLLKMTSNPQNFDLSTAKLTDFAYLDDKYIKNLNINNSNLKGFVKLLLDNINMEKYDKYTTKSIKNKLYSMINIQEEEE